MTTIMVIMVVKMENLNILPVSNFLLKEKHKLFYKVMPKLAGGNMDSKLSLKSYSKKYT